MKTSIVLSILLSLACLPACASEIPPGLEPADRVEARLDAGTLQQVGIAPDQVQAMDRVELAQLEKTDPDQKGGDAVVTVAVIAAIVIIVYLAFQHLDHA